jgi:inorganic pyrophosphatase
MNRAKVQKSGLLPLSGLSIRRQRRIAQPAQTMKVIPAGHYFSGECRSKMAKASLLLLLAFQPICMRNTFRLHPWHGVDIGADAPRIVTAYIEITPSDTVKYEIDKPSGILKVDRPQLYSNVVPALYGFIPQTYCRESVASLCMNKTNRMDVEGDGDPLDILVLTEHRIEHGDILVQAMPIGGFLLIDQHQADDKIIAVLRQDSMYSHFTDLYQLPEGIVTRLKHYFLTYKKAPEGTQPIEIPHVYGKNEAFEVIAAAQMDYGKWFPG